MNESKLTKGVLMSYFLDGCKEKKNWRIGTEHEKFGFRKKNLEPINYSDIQKILTKLSLKFGWEKIFEEKKIIGLKRHNASISLEPGGQIELSGAPLKNLFETCVEVNSHQDELNAVCEDLGIDFMGMGVLPKWTREHMTLMPKKRYKIMSRYMPKVGSLGLDMMLRTCTIQANFDFSSEQDMKKKILVSQSIQPLIIALYANSPFINGKLSNFLSYRSHIWSKTDNDRCGLLSMFCDEEFSIEKYVDYLLDVPMYFIIRNNKYIDLTGHTFRDLMDGKIKKMDATFSDWENHITTIFTEVRLKKIIEVRGADGGPWSRVCALPAFWTGILYDEEILDEIWLIIKSWKFNEIKKFYEDVRTDGLKASAPNNESVFKFTKKIIDFSVKGLKKRNYTKGDDDETIFLEPLNIILDSGKSPAETWKNLFLGEWNNNVDMIYETNYFKVLKKNEKI